MTSSNLRSHLSKCVFWTHILLLQFCAAPLLADTIPTIYAVHKDYFSAQSAFRSIQNISISSHREILKSIDGTVISASSCKDSTVRPDIVLWDESMLAALVKEDETIPNRVEMDLVVKRLIDSKNQYRHLLDKVMGINYWSAYAQNIELSNLIRAAVLKTFWKKNDYVELVKPKLPLVVIMMPTDAIIRGLGRGSNVVSAPRTIVGWSTTHYEPNSVTSKNNWRFVVLTSNVKKLAIGSYFTEYITSTLPHEVAHYFGVPHNFARARHLKSKDSDVKRAAIATRGNDCGRKDLLNTNQFRDVDFFQSNQSITDTVPMWIERGFSIAERKNKSKQELKTRKKAVDFSNCKKAERKGYRTTCETAYSKEIKNGALSPCHNLMMYSRTDTLLTTAQIRLVARNLGSWSSNSKENLCLTPTDK